MDFNDCASEGSVDPSEHRRNLHFETPVEAHLFSAASIDEPSDELEVTSINLSRRGIGLELPHDVAVGRVYNIEIGMNGQKVQSQVRIVSCDPIADGLYRAGGEFC